MVHRSESDRQGPAGLAGAEGVTGRAGWWGRSSQTGTSGGASRSAACFRSMLSPNEQVLVLLSFSMCTAPPWIVIEGSSHTCIAHGVPERGASGRDVAGGTIGTGRSEDVHELAKGARTTVSRIGHANGSLR